MKTVLAITLVLTTWSSAALAQGDHTTALDMEQFNRVKARFYEGNAIQSGESFQATYNNLSTADQNLCTQVCQNVRTQRDTFCEQYMAAQKSGQ